MKRAKEKSRDDALFSALIAVAADGIIVMDERSNVLVYNAACERLFGFPREDVVGRNIAMLMPEPYRSEHDGYVSRYLQTGLKHIIGIGREAIGQRKEGSTFPMYISVGEGRLNSSRIFVGIVHDISERKDRERRIEELQRDLRHATRLSTMGQLSSAIAHELNQPLAAALNYANAAQRLLADTPDAAVILAFEAIHKAAGQIGRAGEIILRMRQFVEKREQTLSLVEVNQAVADAISLSMIGPIGTTIPVQTAMAPGLPKALADRIQIEQVLVNLLLNAADALQDVREPRIRVETGLRADGIIRVAVVDNGIGLSDEARRSLFQPFVTTKPGGMGMGLSICRTIIESHGGRLWAEAAPNAGTIFQFTLPVADDRAQPA